MKVKALPLIKEAQQLTRDNLDSVVWWMGDCIRSVQVNSDKNLITLTLNSSGRMIARNMDWIVKDADGSCAVYSPDDFKKTFEEVKK